MLFFTRGEKCPFNDLTTIKAVNWLIEQDDLILKQQGKLLKQSIENIKEYENEIKKNISEKVKKLKEITGIETLTASIFYTETKGKKMNKAEFANYCGVAPVECSSGLSTRFRNNKRGNRTLNSLLYSISIFQSRFDEEGSRYFQKKLAEGKSKRLARKCLARQVANIIWKALYND